MNTYADKVQKNKSHLLGNSVSKGNADGRPSAQFEDSRSEAIGQIKLQEIANDSQQAKKTTQLQTMANNYAVSKPLQKMENKTGLPNNLKAGIENLSGYTMDDVKVHYNSDKPALLQSHAYAQGADIHLASGQEKHLSHEAWHVVQQKQGRVKPTMQMMGKVNVNDEAGLEEEADVMGKKALKEKPQNQVKNQNPLQPVQSKSKSNSGGAITKDEQKLKKKITAATSASYRPVQMVGDYHEQKGRRAGGITGGLLGLPFGIIGAIPATFLGRHIGKKSGRAKDTKFYHQLIEEGANAGDLDQMLAREPNAEVLLKQKRAEQNGNARRIRRLYLNHNATSAQITNMLKFEPDARVLRARMQADTSGNPAFNIHQLYMDGATSAEITSIMGAVPNPETNSATIHNLIQAELHHNPSRILQLYQDGATSIQITQMLARNPDARVIHRQIQAAPGLPAAQATDIHNRYHNNNDSADNINVALGVLPGLHENTLAYGVGATSTEVGAVIAIVNPPNPVTLRRQIQSEATQNPVRVSSLYQAGATSAQVTAMLRREPDARIILMQIQLEQGNNVAQIAQLYADGAKSDQITQMLNLNNQANLMNQLNTDGANFKQILMMLRKDNNANNLHQLFTDGANAAQIIKILNIVPDAANLHQLYTDGATTAQILTILNIDKRTNRIHQLSVAGATFPQIITMLRKEPKASKIRRLHQDGANFAEIITMLNRENSADRIHALFQAGATAAEIIAFLNRVPDAGKINRIHAAAGGLTFANVNALLGMANVNNDADTLYTQILVEQNNNLARIQALYQRGATRSQINKLLAFQPDAQILDQQIQTEATNNPALILRLYQDGATSAEISNIMNVETNAQTIHQQFRREANKNPTRINQLYVDGANSLQITQMLARNRDARVIHNQIQAAPGLPAAKVTNVHNRYHNIHENTAQINAALGVVAGPHENTPAYGSGATSAEVGAIIGVAHPPTPAVLRAQIGRETKHNATQIQALYLAGATAAEVTTLLNHEHDARILNTQLQMEANHLPTTLLQLYNDGVASKEITALLKLQPNGVNLHNLLAGPPLPPAGYTVGNIEFVTMADGMIGSMYFPNGRIRFTHNSGPAVSLHANLSRFTISASDKKKYEAWSAANNPSRVQKYFFVTTLPSAKPAVVGGGDKLFEFMGVHGATNNHPSRGGPKAFKYRITQGQLNILVHAANTNNNAQFLAWKHAIPALRIIPMRMM